jgi:hypothetical protein
MTPDDCGADVITNIKSQFGRWLFSQGASTVLLCGILIFLGYMALKVYPEIESKRVEEAKQMRLDFADINKSQRQDLIEYGKAAGEQNKAAIVALNNAVVWLSKMVERENQRDK